MAEKHPCMLAVTAGFLRGVFDELDELSLDLINSKHIPQCLFSVFLKL
jgi:hypothetical protein